MTSTRTTYLLNTGEQLGEYRVVRPLGAGGMGQVYLVEHLHLRKKYALKILPADVAGDATFIERFRIEARVMADLEHPGIVRVHNFGSDKGRYYLVMDYVSGPDGSPRTLDDEIAWGNKLAEHVVLDIAIQLCDALYYAHSFPAGAIIHRDLKPGNILIHKNEAATIKMPKPADAAGKQDGSTAAPASPVATPEIRVKVADFGLAKIIGTEYIRAVIDRSTHLTVAPMRQMSPDDQATQVGEGTNSTISVLGTYDYMSPEQKTGQQVDARSDLYALGLILYRMLTGHKPEGTYDPPSRAGVNRRWDPIIAKCLKRELSERYQTADELKVDLLGLKNPKSNRLPLLVGLPVGAAVLAIVAMMLFQRPETTTPVAAPGTPSASTAPASVSVPPATPSSTVVPATLPRVDPPPAAPPVIGMPGGIPMTFKVIPAGARLFIARGTERVTTGLVLTAESTEIPLRPGVYSVRLERVGSRPVEHQLAVGEGHPREWLAEMEQSVGYLHFFSSEGQHISLVGSDGREINLGTPEQQPDHVIYKLPSGRYEAVVTRPDHKPESRVVDILEARPAELRVALQPMPGSIRVLSSAPVDVWERGRQLGRSDEWIGQMSAGAHALEFRRAGFRPATVQADVPPNGRVEIQAPELEPQTARLIVVPEVRTGYIPDEWLPKKGWIQIDDEPEQEVSLPWEGDRTEVGGSTTVRLRIPGYVDPRAESFTLRDRETRTVIFRVMPQPGRLTVESNMPGGIYRLKDGQLAQGWKKLMFGRDVPIGQTGKAVELEPFTDHELTVLADGYQPLRLSVRFDQPGGEETRTITLEPELPDAAP